MQINTFPGTGRPGQATPSASARIFPKITGQKTASRADQLQRTLNEAHDEYREKTYLEEYRAAYQLAKTATLIGHVMSIAFAFTFIFATAYMLLFGDELTGIEWPGDWLQILAAGLITGAVLVFLVEGVKASAFNSVCRSHLKGRFGLMPYFIPLLIVLALGSASIFFSVQGALQVAELHTFVPNSAKVDITGIWAGSDGKIASIEDKIRRLEMGHSPYGWPYGWTDKKTGRHHLNNKGKKEKAKLEAQIAQLEAAREARLTDGRSYNEKVESAAEVDRLLYGGTGAGLSVLAELIILFSIAYRHRYKYKSNQEGELGIGLPLPTAPAAGPRIGFQPFQGAPAMEDPAAGKIGFRMAGSAPAAAVDLAGIAARLRDLEARLDGYRPPAPEPAPPGRTVTVHDHTQGFPITCEHCGKEAIMKSPKAKYCSERCKKDAYNERNPDNQVRF